MPTHTTDHGQLVETAAETLRLLMARRRISNGQVADWLGVSKPSVSNRLSGLTPLTLDDIEVLASKFEVPVSYFLDPHQEVRPASPPQQRSLHQTRHNATVEAAINYSLANGGERVELEDDTGLTIIDNGQVLAQIRKAGRPEGRPAEVAGAGFEPATSGSCAADHDMVTALARLEAYANHPSHQRAAVTL